MNASEITAMRRRESRRTGRLIAIMYLAVLIMLAVRVLLGGYTVTIPDFFRILGGERIPGATFIVMQDKLPRALLGAGVGICFGFAGALFRRVLRNPLASPDILGISQGAAAGAVMGMAFLGMRGASMIVTALLGAFAAAALIALVSTSLGGRGGGGAVGIVGERFLLAGIGIAALGGAVVSFMMARLSLQSAQDAATWTTGSLNLATWDRILVVAIVLAVGIPAALALHRAMEPAELGSELASALGARPALTSAAALGLGVLLAAVATATSGPLAFVALLSTPIAAALHRGRVSLLVSGAVGALIVVAADMIGAEAFGDARLPAGVITGAVGAPVMLWLLVQQRRGARS